MTAPAMTAERALAVLDRLEWCENGYCPACGAWVGRSSRSHDCSLTQARAFFAAMVEREKRIAKADDETIERVARALAIREGWDKWDTAKDFRDTLSGLDPKDERKYWMSAARCAYAALTQEPQP